jgi:serine/threonine-protein kinase RsbT
VAVLKDEVKEIRSSHDVVSVRQLVREWSLLAGFSLVDQTKLVTAASELARNTLTHGGGGSVRVEALNDGPRRGVRVVFEDRGPGIPNVEQALRDGYTTAGGLGLGLGGAKRLCHDFEIESNPGQGTRVSITRWK